MADSAADRLSKLGINLPKPSAPAANYVSAVVSNGLLFVSGQLPLGPSGLEFEGKLGREIDIEAGKQAARLSAINILAQAKAALGDLDRIRRIARLTGFINGTVDFTEPHRVLDGASDLLVEVFGDRGRHSRTVLVAASLPMNAATLIDAIIEVD